MSDHNPLGCVGWDPYPTVAICEHPGCPWESKAATVTDQTDAFLAHHQRHHQEGQ